MIIIVVVVIVAFSQTIANIILFTQSTSCVLYSHCSASNRFIRLLQTARQRFCSSFPTAGRRLRHLVPPSLPLFPSLRSSFRFLALLLISETADAAGVSPSPASGDSKLSPLLRPYQPCCSQTRLTVGEAVASVDMYSLGLGSLPVYIHVYIDLQILLAKIIPCSRCSGLVTSTWEFFYKRANMSEIYTSADISACSDPATVL